MPLRIRKGRYAIIQLMRFQKVRLENTTVRKILIYTFSLSIVSILSFFSGLQLGKSITPLTIQDSKVNTENSEQTCIYELELCLTDQAMTNSPKKENYSLSTFGIYSPLFKNKEVEYQLYDYKRSSIERRTVQIEIENKFSSVVSVTTWLLKGTRSYLPRLPERLWTKRKPTDLWYELFDYPIFDGYEFQFSVSKEKFVSNRIPENPTSSDIYMSKRGIIMYRSKLACPKSYCGAEFHFLTTIDDGKTQMFGQISSGISYLSTDSSKVEIAIGQIFKEIERIADTIDFETY